MATGGLCTASKNSKCSMPAGKAYSIIALLAMKALTNSEKKVTNYCDITDFGPWRVQ